MVARYWSVVTLLALSQFASGQERVVVNIPPSPLPKAKHGKVDDYLAELKKAGLPKQPPLLDFDTLAVGDVGKLPYEIDPARPRPFINSSILQIVDDDEMLVQIERWGWKMSIVGKVAGGAQPVERDTLVVLFRGVSTVDQADGKKFAVGGGFHVSGTYKYATAAGQRTVYVLEPVSLPKIADERPDPREVLEKEAAKEREALAAEAAKVEADERPRLWKDKDGKEIGRGDLLSFKRGFVEIQLESGKKRTLSIAQLSKEDRDWVRSQPAK